MAISWEEFERFLCVVAKTASGSDIDAFVRMTEDGVVHDAAGHTRLYQAADFSLLGALRWLLEHGADVNIPEPEHFDGFSENGFTPLHASVSGCDHDGAVLLLNWGARVNARDNFGRTPLHLAAAEGRIYMCKLLLSRGASLDAVAYAGNEEDNDPEASARKYGRSNTARLLADVRAAGTWVDYVDGPRKELLALRQQLPSLRARGRATPASSEALHERLFLKAPDDIFSHILKFWRGQRELPWPKDRVGSHL